MARMFGRRRASFIRAAARPTKHVSTQLDEVIADSSVSDTETATTLFTCVDDLTSKSHIENGAVISSIMVELMAATSAAGRYEALLYYNPNANKVATATVIADYVTDTYPTPEAKSDVSAVKLAYQKKVQVSGALYPMVFRIQRNFPRGLRLGDNSTILVNTRKNVANSFNWYMRTSCIWYK